MGMSHTRTSSVSKKGCGRMSHQTFLPLSMQWVLINRLMNVSYSAQLAYTSGILVRGKRSNTLQRYDLNPVCMPIQAENQVGTGHQLHVFDHLAVALVGIDLLRLPIGKGMRAGSAQQQAIC